MTELSNTSAAAANTPTAYAGMTTDTPEKTTNAPERAIRLIRWLVVMNLALVALQAISAGFFLSGYERAVTVHAIVAVALQLGALIQAVTAVVLWRRRRLPSWMAGFSIGLLVIVLLQVGFGYGKRYWLHVPIGVGIFGGLMRQATRLDTLRRRNGARL